MDILTNSSNASLTASHLLEYLYCPRFIYFEYVLGIPENQGDRFKVQKGRQVHERARKTNIAYLRKKIGVVDKKIDVYLTGKSGIRGIVDEILFLEDGTASPLDFKYAEYKDKIFKTYHYQLLFYARLIKDNYHVPVNRGFIVYTRSKNKLIEIPIRDRDFENLEEIISDMQTIIQGCGYPGPTRYKKRCLDCCYKNICEQSI